MAAPEVVDIPLLPLRDVVVFPEMVIPLFVGREKSVHAIELALKRSKLLLLCTQRDPQVTEPEPGDIFEIGTMAYIHQVVRLPDGMLKLLVEGRDRARIRSFLESEAMFRVEAERCATDSSIVDTQLERLRAQAGEAFERLVQVSKKITKETAAAIGAAGEPGRLSDLIAASLDIGLADRQFLLEILDPGLRLQEIVRILKDKIEAAEVEQKIQERVKEQMERNQREYYLNEQMKAIRNELGNEDDGKGEFEELRKKLADKQVPAHVRERIDQELKKLKLMAPASAEAAVIRNYLEWILAVPWLEERAVEVDLAKVRAILDEDHYGMDKVKERIVEFLAVRSLTDAQKGPKLCLVGPPGVGKTSLAKSVARALDLEFVRQSLGGVRDEAEIRGHRRTYIAAMPGRIVQGLKKVKTRNPVYLLDEIDKMSSDFRGDPGSALLEVLDPEQNDTFQDHYMDLELDLSRVFFITTANALHSIHRPLHDRLEVIEIGSYTEEEKIEIAERHLLPKQLARNGLGAIDVQFDKPALRAMVRHYTREAGVRNLERQIEAIARKLAVRLAGKEVEAGATLRVTAKLVREYLGTEKYRDPEEKAADRIGVAQGLAWTEVGGQTLLTEVTILPGSGKLEVTGKLGDVMKESARAALSYIRSRAEQLGVDPLFHKHVDLHIHIPEGAVPKDGPSAGITMATALASALTGLPVRGDLAMTGEVTLRGRVLPIGGLKEKLLAAHRAGVKRAVIPAENEKDLSDVPEKVRKALDIRLVADMDDVLSVALVSENEGDVFRFLKSRGARHPLPLAAQQPGSQLPA